MLPTLPSHSIAIGNPAIASDNFSSQLPAASAVQIRKQLETAAKKVKKTCQECAKCKVKCSSTLPRCLRCIERGHRCIYMGEMKRGRKERHHNNQTNNINQGSSKDNNDSSDSDSNYESTDDSNSNPSSKKRSSSDSPPTSSGSLRHAIVNGAPIIGHSEDEILNKASQLNKDIWRIVEKISAESPIQVGSRGYSKRQRKVKDEDAVVTKKPNKTQQQQQNSSSKRNTNQRMEPIMSISQRPIEPISDSVDIKPRPLLSNANDSAPSPNQTTSKYDIIPLSRYELGEAEKKIFISYFDILRHTASSSSPCIVADNLKVFEEKMARFLASTSQVERFNNIFNEIQRGSINNRDEGDVFHSCSSCISLDLENDSFDRFSCLPSANPISAYQMQDIYCASQLSKMAHPTSKDLYLRLDYLTRSDVSQNHLDSHTENRSVGAIQAFTNGEFCNKLNYSSNEVSQFHNYLLGGLLPFGGDVFSLLLEDVNDIKRVLHRFAMKTARSFSLYRVHASGFPSACFTVETMFSVGNAKHPIRLRRRYESGENRSVPSICQILSRNIILQDGSYGGTQLHINFVPIHQNVRKDLSVVIKQKADDFGWIENFAGSIVDRRPESPLIPLFSPKVHKGSVSECNELDDMFNYDEKELV